VAKKPDADKTAVSDFRLAEVLGEHKAREGGYAALARAISEANGRDTTPGANGKRPPDIIDRRKLVNLVEDPSKVVLSLADLRALDHYLERFGEGLAYVPLFKKPDLMQTLADSGRVTFLLGSKPELIGSKREPERWNFSHWDVLAMAEIQRGVNASEVGTRFDIQDVPLADEAAKATKSKRKTGWMELLDDRGPSLVCLGSSRTGPAAEAMLSKMFKRPPFEDAPPEEKRSLPFHFVWNETLPYVFDSHFRLHANDVGADDPEAEKLISDGKASAIAIEKRVLVDRVTPDCWGDTYGVCVAQRRKRGQVWLVLAGVTGAATYVAAKLAKQLATRLHEEKRGQHSDVYWAVVTAHVEKNQRKRLGKLRDFGGEAIIEGPHPWRPSSA
jgi:hypothetical protein